MGGPRADLNRHRVRKCKTDSNADLNPRCANNTPRACHCVSGLLFRLADISAISRNPVNKSKVRLLMVVLCSAVIKIFLINYHRHFLSDAIGRISRFQIFHYGMHHN